jgi:hypothetical protein
VVKHNEPIEMAYVGFTVSSRQEASSDQRIFCLVWYTSYDWKPDFIFIYRSMATICIDLVLMV